MPIYRLKLIEKREVANDTFVLMFEKPNDFEFKPGQYGGFTLINPSETDAGGITRRFSLLSRPDDEHIAIVTRRQNSAYKRVLLSLPINDEVKFAGPTGIFTLHDDPIIPAVLIAGGIGIAPFMCMIRDATAKHSTQQIFLFYGNQSKEDTAFLDELIEIETVNPYFKLIPVFAKPDETWEGETGFITDTTVKKYISDLDGPIYYICGSPVMVTALQETLAEMGINEDRIKIEDFPGY